LLWGLGAVVPHEHPELACQRLDLDPGLPPVASAPALLALLLADQTAAGESVRAIRGGLLYRPRLGAARRPDPAATAACEQLAAPDGGLDALQLAPLARRSPGPGEVELAVAASGLNFRDVLTALGLLGETSPALGGECAGTVVAAGPGVEHLSPGTRVV